MVASAHKPILLLAFRKIWGYAPATTVINGLNHSYTKDAKRSVIEDPPPLHYPYFLSRNGETIENMDGIIEWVAEMTESYTRNKDEDSLDPGESWKEGAYITNGMKKLIWGQDSCWGRGRSIIWGFVEQVLSTKHDH